MLRARICSFCGGDMPASGRIDRRYCRPSCRTLAYRHRRGGRRSDRGSLLDVVRALELRLSATASELLDIRQRFASALGNDAARVTLANIQQAQARDAAALMDALREQESLRQHLVELEGQRNSLRGQVAELTQRAERAQHSHQDRVQEPLGELRRQREPEPPPPWRTETAIRPVPVEPMPPPPPYQPPPVARQAPESPPTPPWVRPAIEAPSRSPRTSEHHEQSATQVSPATRPPVNPDKPPVRAYPVSLREENTTALSANSGSALGMGGAPKCASSHSVSSGGTWGGARCAQAPRLSRRASARARCTAT